MTHLKFFNDPLELLIGHRHQPGQVALAVEHLQPRLVALVQIVVADLLRDGGRVRKVVLVVRKGLVLRYPDVLVLGTARKVKR